MHQGDVAPPLGQMLHHWQRDYEKREGSIQEQQQTLEAILAPDHSCKEGIGEGCALALFTGLLFFRGMQNVYERVIRLLATLPETPTTGQAMKVQNFLQAQQAQAEQEQQQYQSDETTLMGYPLAHGMHYACSHLLNEMEGMSSLVSA